MASAPTANPVPAGASNAPAAAVDKTVNLQILSKSTIKKLKEHFASADVDPTSKMCDRCSKLIGKTTSSKSDYGMDCEPGPGSKCKYCIKTKKTCEYKRPKRLNALLNRLIAQGELVAGLDEDDATYEDEEAELKALQLKFTRRLNRFCREEKVRNGPWKPDSELAIARDQAASLRRIAAALEENLNVQRIKMGIAPTDFVEEDGDTDSETEA